MLIQTSQHEREGFFRRLSFPPAIEAAFQADYFARLGSKIRFGLYLLSGLNLLYLLVPFTKGFDGLKDGFVAAFALVVAVLNVLLLLASRRNSFSAHWQPAIVGLSLLAFVSAMLQASEKGAVFGIFFTLLIASRLQRLQFRWVTIELGTAALFSSLVGLGMSVRTPTSSAIVAGKLAPALFVAAFCLAFNYRGERKERREWWEVAIAEEEKAELERQKREHLENLVRERNEERQKREQTEKMLHILSQAIGGIVHDLGNPLTSVQSGAETLLLFVREGEPDKEMVQEFAEIITDGAQMLNYLRLSLMEQTRVLEGKPVPVEPRAADVRELVKAGAHYQKPKFAGGRKVSFVGDDLLVHVDEMRFITIFMNLIGNALKYSEGEVRISWRVCGGRALIAVQDQGKSLCGITRDQAEKLFVAFGRLDVHTQVEGTGLGLLSVRKIAEAHDGEVYIEGFCDGQSDGEGFSTAQGNYPSMLDPGFCTAFVTTCPISSAPAAPDQDDKEKWPPQQFSHDNQPIFQEGVADEKRLTSPPF